MPKIQIEERFDAMKDMDMTECAYKNGYEKGFIDGKKQTAEEILQRLYCCESCDFEFEIFSLIQKYGLNRGGDNNK